MSVKKLFCIMISAAMMLSAASCSKETATEKEAIKPVAVEKKEEYKNTTVIEKYYDVREYGDVHQYAAPVAANEQSIFYADNLYNGYDEAMEFALYQVDSVSGSIAYDEQAGEVPQEAVEIIRRKDCVVYLQESEDSVLLCRYDIESGKTDSVETKFFPHGMDVDSQGNICLQGGKNGGEIIVYNKKLELVKSFDVSEEIKTLGMDKRFIYAFCMSDDGKIYLVPCEKYATANILRVEDDGRLTDVTGDIAIEEEQNVTNLFVDKDGNLVLCCGYGNVKVEVFSSETGDFVGTYDLYVSGDLIGPSEKYDMVYVSNGEVFGYDYLEDAKECIIRQESVPGLDESFVYGNISEGNIYLLLSSAGVPKFYQVDRNTGEITEYDSAAGSVVFADISENGDLYYVTSKYEIRADEEYGAYESTLVSVYRLGEDGNSELVVSLPRYHRETGACGFSVDKNDNLLLLCPASDEDALYNFLSITVFNKDGSIRKTIPLSDYEYVSSMFYDSDHSVYVCVSDGGKYKLVKINADTYELESTELAVPMNDFICAGNSGYSFFYRKDCAVYGYKSEDASSEEIISINDYEWPYEGFSGELLSLGIAVLSPSEIAVHGGRVLEKASEERLAQLNSKRIITLAVSGSSEDVKENVTDFNFQNDEYRVVVKDYSKYLEEYNYDVFGKDSENLANDIIKGDIPDIILIDDMELSSSIVSGLFTDHKKLIENDPDLDISDFSQNIIDEFTYKDNLFTLPVYHYSSSMFGQNEPLKWDYDALMSCGENADPVFYSSSFYEVFRMLFLSYAHDHVDFETGKCELDNETFVKLLEFIKENSVTEDMYEDTDYGYYNSQFIVEYASEFNDFYSVLNYEHGDGMITPYVYGYPSENGGKRYIIPGFCFSVTENCRNKQAALEFIKTFFDNNTQGVSTIRQKAIESAKTNLIYLETNASELLEKYEDYLDMPVFSDIMYCRLEQIAVECAEEFMNGSISAEEAAKKIQSKITMYLGELL